MRSIRGRVAENHLNKIIFDRSLSFSCISARLLRESKERETRRLLKVVLVAAWRNIPESNSLSPCFVYLFTL